MVEWKTIGDTCIPLRKEIIKQGDLKDDGKYPVVNSGVSLYGYYKDYNNEGNAFTLASRGEYAGFVSYIKDKFWAGGLCYPYRSKNEAVYLTKYIFGYLKNREQNIMDTLVMRGGIPALNKADVDKIVIPIPSLEEQTRIVGILDTFTASIENLKEQIVQRRKQYEYYRDYLFEILNKEPYKKCSLISICKIERGVRVVKKDLQVEGDIPVFQNSLTPLGYFTLSNAQANTAFVISAGAAGEIGYSNVPFWAADDCLCISCPEDLDSRYLYEFLKTKEIYIKSRVRKASIPRLSRTVIEKLEITVLPFQEQKNVVNKLNTFVNLISKLEEERDLRQKQYEYYREKLLTFE